MRRIIFNIAIGFLLVGTTAFGAALLRPGSGGVLSPGFWTLSSDGTGILPSDSTMHIGVSGTRIAKIWATAIDATTITLTSVSASPFIVVGNSTSSISGATSTPTTLMTGGGSVGIGTTQPSSTLHVIGGGTFSTTLTVAGAQNNSSTLTVQGNASLRGTLTVTGASTLGAATSTDFDSLGRVTASTTSWFSGNVGFGTTAPSSSLQVGNPNDATASYFQFDVMGNAPTGADCSTSTQGRAIYVATSTLANEKLYVCGLTNTGAATWSSALFN